MGDDARSHFEKIEILLASSEYESSALQPVVSILLFPGLGALSDKLVASVVQFNNLTAALLEIRVWA